LLFLTPFLYNNLKEINEGDDEKCKYFITLFLNINIEEVKKSEIDFFLKKI
jgi:hypothetical protein